MESIALRDLAHELRQPLSTIEAIAYYLSLILPREDEKTQEQLDRLQRLVEQTNWILSNSMHLNEPAAPEPERINLEELICEAAGAHRTFRLELSGDALVDADPGLARTLVENLFTLFRQIGTEENPVRVRISRQSDGVTLEIASGAPGFRSIAGGALSLACARRMVEAHSGSMNVSVEPASGVRLQVVLP